MDIRIETLESSMGRKRGIRRTFEEGIMGWEGKFWKRSTLRQKTFRAVVLNFSSGDPFIQYPSLWNPRK